MNQKKVELLAPAGNMESLIAAAAAGADAVYLGLKSFSARAFAGNFSHDEFKEAVRYCHSRNIAVYVTINTMLYETEMENAKKEIEFLYQNDCDAVLVQDLGLFHYMRTCYPDFDVHCSTQMHIHNLRGVRFMQQEGASRVVLARETPIELVKKACQTGMDIEVFVYGAICISYSGQCLMSQAVKNRSANRGMCAQCCRLQYYPDHEKHFDEGNYILSPKDLNVIDRIPELIEAGVSSLKIEGRMKRPEYVWLITRTFREAIDAYYRHETYHVSEERQRELLLMFNRGFSLGHMFHDSAEKRMSQYRPNHRGVSVGEVLNYHNGRVQVKLSAPLYQNDGLRILNEPVDTGLTAVKIYKNEKLVSSANAGDTVWLECHSRPHPRRGQSLQKTSDKSLLNSIDRLITENPKTVNIHMICHAFPDKPLYLEAYDDEGHRAVSTSSQNCQKAVNAPLNSDKLITALNKTDQFPFNITDMDIRTDSAFLPIAAVNETRRTVLQELYEQKCVRFHRNSNCAYHLNLMQSYPVEKIFIHSADQSISYPDARVFKEFADENTFMPVVDENADTTVSLPYAVFSSVSDLANKAEYGIAGMNMNIANSYALAYVLSRGAKAVIFSSECSNDQILQSLTAFKNRYGFEPYTYKLVYGKRTVMYIKDSFVQGRKYHSMEDYHGNFYEIAYNNTVTEIKEPDMYRSTNPYCYGSYLILDQSIHNQSEILEEAYEELSKRI